MGEEEIAKYMRQLSRATSAASLGRDTAPKHEGKVSHYNTTWAVALGVILLVCALSSTIIGIVAIVFESQFHDYGPCIWAGMFFLAPGMFGILSRNKMRCLVFGFLGSSITSLVISSNIIVILSIGSDDEKEDVEHVITALGIVISLIAMLTSIFSLILCSMPFCRPPENKCLYCSPKQGANNPVFHLQPELNVQGPEIFI